MANVTNNQTQHRDIDTFVGGNILSLITYGMYTNPLTIYREYLQNAADSIAQLGRAYDGKVKIMINLGELSVTIQDNGPGLSYKQARQELIPISTSKKHSTSDRGFRGIGRLSGLAFGKSVTFMTRCNKESQITKVVWDGDLLKSGIKNELSAKETIRKCVTVEKISGHNYPANFFEVKIEQISRHAAASILNKNAVREYLGEVCPVPFSVGFPYISNALMLFEEKQPFVLDVRFDNEDMPVTRLHKNRICVSGNRSDQFVEFEEIKIPSLEKSDYSAIGWIAHSSYFGALPKKLGVRGLRARVGNIQIGDETVFDHLFSENRFNRWCVAEIHILDPRIVPNGKRDYFEASVHLRNFENHLGVVCRNLEQQCRIASQKRNQKRIFQSFLENLESVHDLAISGYLTTTITRQLIDEQLSEISVARKKYEQLGCRENSKQLGKLHNKLNELRSHKGRSSLAGVKSSDVSAYRKIFKILIETSPSLHTAKETIETILEYKSK